jgi:general secretion pathway protein F
LSNTGSGSKSIRLEDLIALNDEIAALARAGVPLDEGLLHLGRDLPGNLGRTASALAKRLERGEPLDEAMRGTAELPNAYLAIVACGLRSGQLAVALQDMATLLRRSAELRRLITSALFYPLFVLLLGFALFSFTLLAYGFPQINHLYEDVAPSSSAIAWLQWLAASSGYWILMIPVMILLSFGFGWWRIRYGWLKNSTRVPKSLPFSRVSVRNTVQVGRLATMTETLATLLKYQVPLGEALRLATEASGNRGISKAGRQLATRVERGENLGIDNSTPGVPPLLQCMLASHRTPDNLVAALHRLAESYRATAQSMVQRLSIWIPIGLTVSIGGLATAFYAVSVIWPFSNLLLELSRPGAL